MRIVTVNVNGIRSAGAGLCALARTHRALDVVCLQEIKAHVDDVPRALAAPRKSHASFHTAAKRGYGGVALYSKRPASVQAGFGSTEFDAEGRYVEADFGHLSVISVYLPSGSGGPAAAGQIRFLEFLPHLLRLRDAGRGSHPQWRLEHCASAHRSQELAQQSEEFRIFAEERAWLTRVFGELRLRRRVPSPQPGTRSVHRWSNRGQAWAKNVGWRIDYQIATPGIAATARTAAIYTHRRFSDHAPLIIDYDYDLH
jgi:exodeoxyribonuclease-3